MSPKVSRDPNRGSVLPLAFPPRWRGSSARIFLILNELLLASAWISFTDRADTRRLMGAHCRQQEEQVAAARQAALDATGLAVDARQPHLSYLCFDVEATCMSGKNSFDYPNEIIVSTNL